MPVFRDKQGQILGRLDLLWTQADSQNRMHRGSCQNLRARSWYSKACFKEGKKRKCCWVGPAMEFWNTAVFNGFNGHPLRKMKNYYLIWICGGYWCSSVNTTINGKEIRLQWAENSTESKNTDIVRNAFKKAWMKKKDRIWMGTLDLERVLVSFHGKLSILFNWKEGGSQKGKDGFEERRRNTNCWFKAEKRTRKKERD